MANEKVVMTKEEKKEITGYRLLVTSFVPHLSGRRIYLHANGLTFEFEDGEEVDVPVLVKEMLDDNVRNVYDPRTKRYVKEMEYKYSIIKTYEK